MALNPLIPWSLQQAIDRGFEWYPIQVTRFGDAGASNVDPDVAVDPLLVPAISESS